MTDNENRILEYGISGYHQYVLNAPMHLEFASENLCALLETEREDLLSPDKDLYLSYVHPADREKYADFLCSLTPKSSASSLQYRLVTKGGRILSVCDTMTVIRREDGVLIGSSVLTDLTAMDSEALALQFLNDTIPCGVLKYSCDKHPRITYINDRMLEILRFDPALERDRETLEMYSANLLSMILPEERPALSEHLSAVSEYSSPISGELTVLRCDGTRGVLFGWITRTRNVRGEEEFQSVCMDITERHEKKQSSEIGRYIKALKDVYDLILEYDAVKGCVSCLHAPHSVFSHLLNLPLQMHEATEGCILDAVVDEDREMFRQYFQEFFRRTRDDESDFSQIYYRAYDREGRVSSYVGLFIKVTKSVSLFCARKRASYEERTELRSRIVSLEKMQDLVMGFTDGIAGFEITGDSVKPLYISENVINLFGYSREEWLHLMREPVPIRDFLARSRISYAEVLNLFETGQGEFSYHDHGSREDKKIRAVCSRRSSGSGDTIHVMLYNPAGKDVPAPARVSIRTFGYFDVFVSGKPIAFRSEKAKELLALLVDRKGGFISSEEAIAFLWPEEAANPVTMSRYRKVALRLKNLLAEYGVSDICETVDGKRRIIPDNIQCDLYDYLSGKEEFAQSFKGSYLSNYSWGEMTLTELMGSIIHLED